MSVDAIGSINPSLPLSTSDASTDKRQQVAIAAREFEAMFLLQMLKQMRQSMLAEDEKEAGLGADTMVDTIDAELSRHLAGQPGGLSDVIAKALGGRSLESETPSPAKVEGESKTLGPMAGALAKTESPAIALPPGRVTSDYGWRSDPLTGATRFHRGVDIAAAYGQEVPAAAEGTVVFSGTQGGYGNLVVVRHEGGAETRYAHLSQLDVREGDQVRAGDIIGRVGQTGRATGPHLHFELRESGRPVDPH